MFTSLKNRNFRIYWFGMLISVVGTWIQIVAQGWLVYQLTRSSFLLGLVGFISYIPIFLFSLIGGAVADRIDKRNLLIITQISFMTLAFLLAGLSSSGIVKPWHIMIIALFNGIIMSFDMPTRQAIVLDIVGREHLLNAVALNSAAFNAARIVGPALAGILIASIGSAGCFFINGITFFAVIIALFIIRVQNQTERNFKSHILEDIKGGLSYVWNNDLARTLILMTSIPSLFGMAYIILMPVFAEEVFGRGAQGLGWLMSANGIGALLGALFLAKLGDFKRKGLLLIIAPLVFSSALMCFAFFRNFWFNCLCLVFTGWGGITSMASINTILQLSVPNQLRGRIMSMFMLTFAGLMPLGNLVAGSLSLRYGVQSIIGVGGVICLVSFGLIALLKKGLREI